jgi:hypothetical protein
MSYLIYKLLSKYNHFLDTMYAFRKINLRDADPFLDSGNPLS